MGGSGSVGPMAGQGSGELGAGHGVTLLGWGEIESWAMSRWGEAVGAGEACECWEPLGRMQQ